MTGYAQRAWVKLLLIHGALLGCEPSNLDLKTMYDREVSILPLALDYLTIEMGCAIVGLPTYM